MAKTKYTEPSDYIPKDIRKKLKLGEFADESKTSDNKDLNKQFRDYINNKQ